MNNEAKNIPEVEVAEERGAPTAEKKGLSKGALIGIIAGAAALVVVAVVLIILLGGGSKCENHVDKDDDFLCDSCGVDYDDGIEKKEITFRVKLDNGEALSGVKFTLTRGGNSITLISRADGTVKQALDPGAYAISYDYATIPEYCSPDTAGFKVQEGTTDVDILIIDNNPDGSANKPYFASEENEITLAPGQEIYFNYRGSTEKDVEIYADGIEINYNGNTYTAENGALVVHIIPDDRPGAMIVFSVKNTTAESIVTTMKLTAMPGSSENPYELTENSASVTVSAEQTVCYSWVADKTGVLVLTDSTEKSNILLTKIIGEDIPITTQTDGTHAAYLPVTAGESVSIAVSVDTKEEATVNFELRVYAGTESDPVPALKDEIGISLAAHQTVVFKSEAGKTLTINEDKSLTVENGSISYSNTDLAKIEITLTDAIFTITNESDVISSITIKLN